MKMIMNCPNCKFPLILDKKREFETLGEHVCNPNQESFPLRKTYKCKNVECEASKGDIFWDDFGDFYGWSSFKFPEDLTSAIPSPARRIEREVYKKGLKRKIKFSPWLTLYLLQPMIEFNYKCDDYGKVLKRTAKLKWLRKDSWLKKDEYGFHTYYLFPIMNIIHTIKSDYDILIKSSLSDSFKTHHINDMFKPAMKYEKRKWIFISIFLKKILFFKTYKKYKIDNSNKNSD